MILTLVENSTVVVIAVLIYIRQKKANAQMELRINNAIEDTKRYITTEGIPAMVKEMTPHIKGVRLYLEEQGLPDVMKSLKGWWANLSSQGSKAVEKAIVDSGVEMPIGLQLIKAKKEDRLALLAGHLIQNMSQQQQINGPPQDQVPTPEEYAKQYQEAYGDGSQA